MAGGSDRPHIFANTISCNRASVSERGQEHTRKSVTQPNTPKKEVHKRVAEEGNSKNKGDLAQKSRCKSVSEFLWVGHGNQGSADSVRRPLTMDVRPAGARANTPACAATVQFDEVLRTRVADEEPGALAPRLAPLAVVCDDLQGGRPAHQTLHTRMKP